MAQRKNASDSPASTAANASSEAQLWQIADTLPGNVDAAAYKHIILGLT